MTPARSTRVPGRRLAALALVAALVVAGPAAGAAVARPGPDFDPAILAGTGGTPDVMVLGTVPCGRHYCVQMWRASGGGDNLAPLTAPPGAYAAGLGFVDGGTAVFANVEDGYWLASPGRKGTSSFTTDGGATWHPLGPGLVGLSDVVADGGYFYGLLARCASSSHCTYRLARSPVGPPRWSSVPIPGAGDVRPGYVSLAASQARVWALLQARSQPVLAMARVGRPPFAERAEPSLASVVRCALYPMSRSVIWAECPTGMMVSWSRTADGGHHFTRWWETSGTGGSSFDPVSPTVAYRYTGTGPGPAYALQRTTDGGARFTTVGRLFLNAGSQPVFAFIDQEQGYALGPGRRGPVVLYTGDGGRHWKMLFADGPCPSC